MDRHSKQHGDRFVPKFPPEVPGRGDMPGAGDITGGPARRPLKLPGAGDAPETGGVPRQISEPLRREDIETL